MIRPDKERAGIKAIENVASIARYLALKGLAGSELAKFLDHLTYLPQLILEPEDRTEQFIACLKELCAQVPECQMVLKDFEAKPET